MQQLKGAQRLIGFDQPTVWTKFTSLAIETQSINLGQGFPAWDPPQFYKDSLQKAITSTHHQYTRAYGSLKLINTISEFYKPIFNRTIDPLTNICVSAGGVCCINAVIQGLVNQGDEVVLIDPSYDAYRAQIQIAGGITKSVSLKPVKIQSKQEILAREASLRYKPLDQDKWTLDFNQLENIVNDKTKIIIVNTPHNPTGKVFTLDELEKIASIALKYPNCYIIEDAVYEHLGFGYEPFKIPRMGNVQSNFLVENQQQNIDMWDRTISICSAGKLFSATGVRVGWCIGPKELIKYAQAYHQYNVFCMYEPIQTAIAESLEIAKNNTYFQDLRNQLQGLKNKLVDCLLESKYDFNIWIPESGYFILTDISKETVDQKYFIDQKTGENYSKDFAFSIKLGFENKVIGIPCSVFYDIKNKKDGENFVRYAFCKTEQMIQQASQNLK